MNDVHVLIDDDSCGRVVEAPRGIEKGNICKIELNDENGNKFTKLGWIVEII